MTSLPSSELSPQSRGRSSTDPLTIHRRGTRRKCDGGAVLSAACAEPPSRRLQPFSRPPSARKWTRPLRGDPVGERMEWRAIPYCSIGRERVRVGPWGQRLTLKGSQRTAELVGELVHVTPEAAKHTAKVLKSALGTDGIG